MKPKLILQISVLLAAALSLALSITLYFAGNDESDKLNGIYVGVWVPSILALGAFILAGRKGE
jgi:predicted small secreted protein